MGKCNKKKGLGKQDYFSYCYYCDRCAFCEGFQSLHITPVTNYAALFIVEYSMTNKVFELYHVDIPGTDQDGMILKKSCSALVPIPAVSVLIRSIYAVLLDQTLLFRSIVSIEIFKMTEEGIVAREHIKAFVMRRIDSETWIVALVMNDLIGDIHRRELFCRVFRFESFLFHK